MPLCRRWYVKWGYLHYKLKGSEEWKEIDIPFEYIDCIDYKWPNRVKIYEPETDELIDEVEN